jgi:hypothetical protein
MARTKATARKGMRGRVNCVIEEFWPGGNLDFEVYLMHAVLGPLPGVAIAEDGIDPVLLRAEAFEWSHAEVLEHFSSLNEPVFVELVQKEKLTGRAMHMLLERRELLVQRHPTVPLGDLARFEAELEKLFRCDDAVIVISCSRSLWLASNGKSGADEIMWYRHVQAKTVFDRVVVSLDAHEENEMHKRHVELRFAEIAGVSKGLDEDCVIVAFRAPFVVLHHACFDPETVVLSNVQKCPVEAHFVEHGKKIQSISYDLYNFSWTPKMHSLMPRKLRLALRELVLIRRFRPDHAFARFDKNLLLYLFSFATLDVVTPVPLSMDSMAKVRKARALNACLVARTDFNSDASFEATPEQAAFAQSGAEFNFEFREGVNEYVIGEGVVKFGDEFLTL